MAFEKKSEAFGIDFSEFSLKIARLEKNGNILNLASFGEVEIPAGVILESQVKEEKLLAKLIKKAISEVQGKKINSKHAIISLPEEKSFLDVFQMPILEPKELESAVRFEAENHIPMGVDDVYFDFETISSLGKTDKFQEVLVAATPRDIADSYLVALKIAGIQARAAEIECLAVVRALIKNSAPANPLLIIDFGGNRTTFMICSGHSARFTSTIPISSKMFTDIISQKLNVGSIEAERLKRQEGLTGDKKIAQAMLPLLNGLVEQIKNHLKYYYSHIPKTQQQADTSPLEKIMLCGGGSNLKGFPEFLSSSLNMPAEYGNPWVNIFGDDMKDIPALSFEKSLGYATALGLALRGVYGY